MLFLVINNFVGLQYSAEPGTGRENIKYIKAYGFMAFLVASEVKSTAMLND